MATKLTQLKIEQIKPKPHRVEIPDRGCPGLYLVVHPSGSKSWAVRYRNAAGQQRKLTLDTFCSLATAHKLTRKAMDEIAEGHDPAAIKQIAKQQAVKDAANGERSFSAVAQRFVHQYARKQEKLRTWQEVARLLGLKPDPENDKNLKLIKGGIVDRWGRKRIDEITKHDVVALIDSIAERITDEGGNGVGANRSLAVVRKLFNWAVSKVIIQSSPCTGVVRPVKEKSRDRKLSDDELRWFWQACDKMIAPSSDERSGESVFGFAFKVLLLTGQRRGEVGEMSEAELDLAAVDGPPVWSLPPVRTKNGRPHLVPLSVEVVEIIRAVPRIRNKAGFVFCTNGESAVSGWSRAKEQLDAIMLDIARAEAKERGEDPNEVKIEPWVIHDLRRTASTRMQKFVAPHVVEAVLNHVSGFRAGVAGVYNKEEYFEEKRAALDALARHLGGIVTGGGGTVTSIVEARVARVTVTRRLAVDAPINSEQLEKLRKLIKETGTDLERLLAYLKADDLESLSVSGFFSATEILQAKQRMTPEGTGFLCRSRQDDGTFKYFGSHDEKERVTKRDILQSAPRLLDMLGTSRQLDDGTFSLSPDEATELSLYLGCTMPRTSDKRSGRPSVSPNVKLLNWFELYCEVKAEQKRLGARGTQQAALRAIAERTLNGKEMKEFDAVEKKVDALRKRLEKGPELADAAPKLADALLGPSRKRFSGT